MDNASFIFIIAVIFLIAALSGLGVGSGGLLVIFLTSALKFSPTDARVTNLLFFIISSTGALIIHSAKGRIRYKLVLCAAAFGILGTLIGTSVGRLIGDTVLKFLFGIMLVLSGTYSIFGRKIKKFIKSLVFPRKNPPAKL